MLCVPFSSAPTGEPEPTASRTSSPELLSVPQRLAREAPRRLPVSLRLGRQRREWQGLNCHCQKAEPRLLKAAGRSHRLASPEWPPCCLIKVTALGEELEMCESLG